MNLQQTVTLVVGLMVAALSVGWARAESKRDGPSRYALISGPYGGGTLWVVLIAVAALVPLLYLLFAFELVPKGAPGLFTLTLGWICAAWVAAIFAGVAIQVRRNAVAWLTVVGDDQLCLEQQGTTTTVKLQAGGARLFFIAGGPQYVQFLVSDEAHKLTFWGQIGLRGFQDVTEGAPVQAQGLMLAGSAERLRKWLAPYIAKG
ncbi:MAG TPA: hypothetical protein VG937_08865 [Polyangiaceae bacterium]|nr:hypothetical protein [Polyangiaceae bacterium]